MSLKKKTIALFLVTFVILIIIPSMVNATTYSYSDTEQGIEWLYELDSGGNVVNLKCNTTSVTGTVTIPSTIEGKTVISVGSDAFKGRIALTSITIPSTVKEIEYSAFEGCTNLSSVDLGNVEAISFDVFKGCTSLTSITIPKSLKSGAISPVFTNCTNLTNITLEEGLTVVPSHLCATTGITEIAIPSTVKEIEYSAFEGCTNLSSVDLGNVEAISFDVFKGCTSLTSITIPKSLKSGAISPVFTNCTDLTNIKLEEGLTVVPSYLCATTGITEIAIPSTVKKIEYSAFEGCTNLSSVDLENIEAISFDVFKDCTSLTSITIPKSLKSGAISPVFTNCTNLTNITLEEGLTVVPSHLCATTGITEIAIPSTVKEIEYSAFEDCAQLEKITILDNVEKIGFDFQAEDYVFVNHNDNLTIYCYEGTVAAEYAKEKDIKFVYLQKTTEGDENQGTDNKDENEQNTTDGKKDDTTAKQELPKAGKMTIISILIAAIIAGTTSFIKTKKYKEI